ncbi:hypothetical protein V5O48_014710 [Marasmius crinis-equi]|uniref:Uncharacterized protein n=1 Tax=Marasmius crinis-equi TaxID=585013 RepID=A0ABR3EWI9_9AGAR
MPAKVNPKAKRGSQNASQGKKESANVSQARKGGYHMSKPGQFAEALPAVADSDEAARLMEFKLHDLKISMTRMQQEVEDSSRPGRRATPRRAAQLGTQIAEAKEKVADLEPKVQDLRRVHSEKRAALDAILKQEKSAASSDPEGVKPVEVSEPKEGESSGSDGKGIAGLDGESDLSDLDEDHDEGNGDSEKGRKRGRSKAGATEQSSRKRAKTTPTTKPTRKKTRPKAQEKLPKAKEFHLQEDQGANTMNTDAPNKEPKPAPKSPAGTGHGEHAQRPNTVNNGGESQQLGTAGNQATGSEGVLDEADLKEACKGDEHGRDGDGNDKGESGESGNGEGGKSYDSRPQATTSQGEPDAVEHDGGGDEGRKNDDPGVVSSAKTNQDNVSETPADKQANEGAVPAAKTNEKANEERVVSATKINEKNVHEKKEGKGSNLQVHAQVPEAIDAHRNEGSSDKGATTPQGASVLSFFSIAMVDVFVKGSQPQGSGEDCEEKSGGNQAVAAPTATPGPETSQSKPDREVKKKKRASKTRVTRVQGRSLQVAAAEEPEESHVDESDEEKTESWEFWKPEVRASMEVECQMQVARYLADPTGLDVHLSDRARAYVRYDAQNFPGAATTCFDLARDVLVSGKGLIRCVYHHYSDKSTKKHDHSRDFMTGV